MRVIHQEVKERIIWLAAYSWTMRNYCFKIEQSNQWKWSTDGGNIILNSMNTIQIWDSMEKKNRWFVHTAWVQQHIHFMHALNVKPYRKGNNWNRAKLQLFNLPFGYVVSLAVSLFSQLIIYFHYSPTEFILSSFLWCELVSNGFETKKGLTTFPKLLFMLLQSILFEPCFNIETLIAVSEIKIVPNTNYQFG